MKEGPQILTSRRGLFYGWIVVVTSAVGLLLGSFPIVVFSFGVFFRSYTAEFNAGRGAISFAFTIHNLLSGISAVLVGRIADRVGARKVILPGLAIVAAMLISAEAIGSRVGELYLFYAALGLVAPLAVEPLDLCRTEVLHVVAFIASRSGSGSPSATSAARRPTPPG